MIILYIPFILEDALYDLDIKAEKWCRQNNENNKNTEIVLHQGLTDFKRDKIMGALKDGEGKIYVLSHGVNSSQFIVSNQAVQNDQSKELTIEQVALNFKNDLINAIDFSRNNIIKLYFCDTYSNDNKAKNMAAKFRESLGDAYSDLEVQYYRDILVSRPSDSHPHDSFGQKKAWRKIEKINNFCYFKLKCLVGNPKFFRDKLNNAEKSYYSSHTGPSITEIKYPNFSHPLITEFAMTLVKLIQNDKILAQRQNEIIPLLLTLLPMDINDYLMNAITITCQSLMLEISVNKKFFTNFKSGFSDLPRMTKTSYT